MAIYVSSSSVPSFPQKLKLFTFLCDLHFILLLWNCWIYSLLSQNGSFVLVKLNLIIKNNWKLKDKKELKGMGEVLYVLINTFSKYMYGVQLGSW